MNKYWETIITVIALILFIGGLLFMNGSQNAKIANQATLIEQLQGDVKAMTSAFKEISIELLRSQYAYVSWSKEIKKLRKAMSDAPEIPPAGRWGNRKKATKEG